MGRMADISKREPLLEVPTPALHPGSGRTQLLSVAEENDAVPLSTPAIAMGREPQPQEQLPNHEATPEVNSGS